MFYEYAVEPKAVGSNWHTCRYIIEKFGFDRGRLISEFPGRWLREAYDATLNLPDMEKKRVVEALASARMKLVRSSRQYDPAAGDWLFNALKEHGRQPFRGIIAYQNSGKSHDVMTAGELDEHSPQMIVATSVAVPRDATSMSTALEAFLTHGSRIAFVDPYFNLFNQKYKSTLKQCLLVAAAKNPKAECEIHYRFHEKNVEPTDIEKSACSAFSGLIPAGIIVKVFCWRQKEGGEDFHARYLLTDKGGVGVEAGFSAEGKNETTDMHLLELGLCKARLDMFTPPSTTFDLVGPVLSVDASGKVKHV